ncbi:MAG: hypothetical protein ACFFCS_01610 [Candidatus Hodarchaeota archaeon]
MNEKESENLPYIKDSGLKDMIKAVDKDFIERIEEILQKILDERLAIKGIIVGTHGGTIISSIFRESFQLNPKEMAAATTSLLFISSKAISKILDDKFKLVTTFSSNYILLCILTRNISFGVILDRKLVELDGIQHYIDEFTETTLRITRIIETSDVSYSDLFTKIQIAIPGASMYAIATKDGLPIKIQSNKLDEARVSAFISAIFNINHLITSEDAEFATVVGDGQSIIIHILDKARILAIGVPSEDNSTLMKYILRIKELINS